MRKVGEVVAVGEALGAQRAGEALPSCVVFQWRPASARRQSSCRASRRVAGAGDVRCADLKELWCSPGGECGGSWWSRLRHRIWPRCGRTGTKGWGRGGWRSASLGFRARDAGQPGSWRPEGVVRRWLPARHLRTPKLRSFLRAGPGQQQCAVLGTTRGRL